MMVKFEGYTIVWDEENQVVRLFEQGPINDAVTQWLVDQTEAQAVEHGDHVNWLAILSGIAVPSTNARKHIAQHQQHPSIHKYALVGASTLIRTVAIFIATASGVKNSRHFSTEAEARVW